MNCCVQESLILEKYKDLRFYDPDDKVIRIVYSKNLQWQKGVRGKTKKGWTLIGVGPGDGGDAEDLEGFEVGDMVIELIAKCKQADGIEIVHQQLLEGDGVEEEV